MEHYRKTDAYAAYEQAVAAAADTKTSRTGTKAKAKAKSRPMPESSMPKRPGQTAFQLFKAETKLPADECTKAWANLDEDAKKSYKEQVSAALSNFNTELDKWKLSPWEEVCCSETQRS